MSNDLLLTSRCMSGCLYSRQHLMNHQYFRSEIDMDSLSNWVCMCPVLYLSLIGTEHDQMDTSRLRWWTSWNRARGGDVTHSKLFLSVLSVNRPDLHCSSVANFFHSRSGDIVWVKDAQTEPEDCNAERQEEREDEDKDREKENRIALRSLLMTACAISSEELSVEWDGPTQRVLWCWVGIGRFGWSGISTVNCDVTKEQELVRRVECVQR